MTAEIPTTTTETFKYTFKPKEGATPITNSQQVIEYLQNPKIAEKFVLLNNGASELQVIGDPGKTGLVILDANNRLVAAVKHPNITPKALDTSIPLVEFGGQPDTSHIEPFLEVPVGEDRASIFASLQLEPLRKGVPFYELATNMSGAGGIGIEPEAWIINPETGDLIPESAGELQSGLLEETLAPIADPNEFLAKRAQYNLDRASQHPDSLVTDLSVLPTSSPEKIKINTGHDLGPYVFAIQHWLKDNYFNSSDPTAESVIDQLAQSAGFTNHANLKDKIGHMGYWVMAASHASLGMNHLREGLSALHVPAEAAIAIADIFNSDLATVAELLMFSTPIIFNQTPKVGEHWPRDYRSILRYLMDTADPAPFISNVNTMYSRIAQATLDGTSHTIDRASYIANINGRQIPVMHGRVRNRAASSEPRNQSGRIEFTGCSASPSIYDEQARNGFLQILSVLALEAVESKKHPTEHFGTRFPHLDSWSRQKDIAITASLKGFQEPTVKEVISESLEVIDYARIHYPSLSQQANIASTRIQNLLQPPVTTLKEYVNNPQGPISEVIQQEISRGTSGLDVAKMIHQYQIQIAQNILNH